MDLVGGDREDDAAVLSELLAWLSDDPSSDTTSPGETSPDTSTRKRPAGRTPPNSTARRKKEIDRLRRETAQLTGQLEGLRAASRVHPYAHLRERASRERHRRRVAEQERETLHAALAQQTLFLNGLYDVFTMAPRLAVIHHCLALVALLVVSQQSVTPRRGVAWRGNSSLGVIATVEAH